MKKYSLFLGILLLTVLILRPIYAQGREDIKIGWKNLISQPRSLTMSSGGKYCGIVDRDSNVRIYDQNGKTLWRQKVDGATDVLIAHNGESVLVYSKLNPIFRELHFFRRDGRRIWKHQVESSIWSGAVSSDGMHVAITTGDRYLYLYKPDPERPTFRRWRLDGIGYKVTFTPDNKRLIVGTWQNSTLACYDIERQLLWSIPVDEGNQYELKVSADSKTILGVIQGSRHNARTIISLWDADGNQLWKKEIDGFDAFALVSPQSQYVAVSYAGFISKEGSGIIERKVVVYKEDGELLWEKGGLFFGPRLIALSPLGSSVIVSDGERSLYNIDRRGRILSRQTLEGAIRRNISSEDGKRVLLYSGDGWLYYLNIGDD